MEELCTEVQEIDPDIIAVSESWANDSIGDSELSVEGYTLFRKDRVLDIKGGVFCCMSRRHSVLGRLS